MPETDMHDHEYEHEHEHDHDHKHHHDDDKPISVGEAVGSMLILGQVALDKGDYESAAEAYRSAIALEPNENALYNLASLHARGLGVRKNYLEAGRLFHQAELLGNKRAGSLCRKCMFDFVHEGIEHKTPTNIYAAMAVFVSMVFPEAENKPQEIRNGLFAIATTCGSKGEDEAVQKVLKAMEEITD